MDLQSLSLLKPRILEGNVLIWTNMAGGGLFGSREGLAPAGPVVTVPPPRGVCAGVSGHPCCRAEKPKRCPPQEA